MRRSKSAEAQIAFILRQCKEDPVIGEIFRKAGISNLLPSEMKRLHQLKEENGKLKKILADLLRYKKMLQDSH